MTVLFDMTDTLFYDGMCPLCAGEIRLLQRLKGDKLALIDIHSDNFKVDEEVAAKRNQMLAVLHLRTKHGVWLLGLDATVAAWKHTQFGWLLSPLRWIGVKSLADWAYFRWAGKRACRPRY